MARYEIDAWKAHNRKRAEDLADSMGNLYALLYQIPYDEGYKAGQHTAKAAWLHDQAEAEGDDGNTERSKQLWLEVLDELTEHYKILIEAMVATGKVRLNESEISSRARKLAQHDTKRWLVHHERDYIALKREMTAMYSLLLGEEHSDEISHTIDSVVEALKIHDVAEDLEEKGSQAEADKHWKKAEEQLVNHFTMLMELNI